MAELMPLLSLRSLAVATGACVLLAGCGLGQARVNVTPGAQAGAYSLQASKKADYTALGYQTVMLEKSANLAIENGYQYFEVDKAEINSAASRSRRTATWQIRLHNDPELAKTSLQTYRAAEVLDTGLTQQAFWIKNEAPGTN